MSFGSGFHGTLKGKEAETSISGVLLYIMKILNFVLFIISFVIIVSFFLPWISIRVKGSSSMSSIFNNDLGKVKTIAGYEIPKLANKKDSRTIMRVLQLFVGKLQNLDRKSYYIYSIPTIAIITILVSGLGKNCRLVALILFILGCGVYVITVYKIYTTNLDLTLFKLNIEKGIKYTQYSFLAIGIVGFIRLIFLS